MNLRTIYFFRMSLAQSARQIERTFGHVREVFQLHSECKLEREKDLESFFQLMRALQVLEYKGASQMKAALLDFELIDWY